MAFGTGIMDEDDTLGMTDDYVTDLDPREGLDFELGSEEEEEHRPFKRLAPWLTRNCKKQSSLFVSYENASVLAHSRVVRKNLRHQACLKSSFMQWPQIRTFLPLL